MIMTAQMSPYLSFHGDAKAALEFYHSVLGGTLEITRYDSIPGMMGDADESAKVMHGQIATDDGFTLMASDYSRADSERPASSVGGTSVCVWGDDEKRLTAIWHGLQHGGNVRFPFELAPWGDTFGELTDKFGVVWMLVLSHEE